MCPNEGRNVGTCRLCLQDGNLCRSHIFPEFFYRPMYDEKRRFYKVSSDPKQRTLFSQQGIYEYLLCKDCETQISRYEMHASKLFFEEMSFHEIEPGLIRVVDLDYDRFKLFQMSLLWRAGVASNTFFKVVKLGPHEERLRKMILDEDPGENHEYGCIVIALAFEQGQAFNAMLAPEKGRVDSLTSYRFTLGSCLWAYLVANHTESFGRKHYLLQTDGSLLLHFMPAKDVPFIRNTVIDFLEKGKLKRP